MKLADYRFSRGWSQEKAAALFSTHVGRKVKQSQWSKWENGTVPDALTAMEIDQFTKGEVQRKDFLDARDAKKVRV